MAEPFVDWLSVSQHHRTELPEFVGSIKFTMDEAGEIQCESGGRRTVRGSYDSSLQVCSHGGWVRVSGNPARWGKPDNLAGYDLDESVGVFNEVLSRLGLPGFEPGLELEATTDEVTGCRAPRWTGAAFSRIDLTANYETGDETLAKLVIKDYAGRAGAYLRKAVYGDETAIFHNSRRSVKAYRKGPDMAVHCKGSPWTEWAQGRGIVRHEVALKSRLLSDTGLRYWGNCTMGKLAQLFERETAVLRIREGVADADAALALRPSARVVYAAWSRGVDVRALHSRAQFYRYRKQVREALGVDIAETVAMVVPMRRAVELRPLRLPADYWQREAA